MAVDDPDADFGGLLSSTDTQKKSADAERAAAPPPAEKAPEPAPAAKAPEPVPAPPPKKVEKAPEEKAATTFKVKFDTSKGPVIIEVHRDWAPIGAAHFEQLVKSGFYNGARFFRVVPNFVVQFGLAADPAVTKKWDNVIQDDPVTQTNRIGTLTYATRGPGTRTTQLFINIGSNQGLDAQGFAPFGIVIEGMSAVQQIYPGYGERPDQGEITNKGNAYLEANFPQMDYIKTATIMK